jgi:hypothetical protein
MSDGATSSIEGGLELLAEILSEALAATPWLARIASVGAAAYPLRVLVSCEEGGDELSFAAMDVAREEVVGTWSYYGLRRLHAPSERMVAYASCVARVVAGASVADRLSDMIPAPALLVLPEIVTQEDFERERLNVELEEHAVAKLREG